LGGPNPHTVFALLVVDVALLLLLACLVAWRLFRVWVERRSGAAGSKLHVRLVVMFSVVAVTPAIVVAVFSAALIHYGVEQWFNKRVSTALDESLAVANAYLEEHQEIVVGDALAMANDINREGVSLLYGPYRLDQLVATQAAIRGLSDAVIFDSSGQILARAGLGFSMELSIDHIPQWAFDRARSGRVAVLTNPGDDRVRALVELNFGVTPAYLYVGRYIDPKVLDHLERTSRAAAEYKELEGRRYSLEITFSAIFAVVALRGWPDPSPN
jgi:two-component system nitrogen regulation sensor histidine kinase NtrY